MWGSESLAEDLEPPQDLIPGPDPRPIPAWWRFRTLSLPIRVVWVVRANQRRKLSQGGDGLDGAAAGERCIRGERRRKRWRKR